MRRVSVVIVGGGPAGASAALAARQAMPDAEVLLLDKQAFPRDKACGDGVAGHVLDELEELGVGDLVRDRKPTSMLELGTTEASSVRPIDRPIWGVPRRVLDQRLVDAAVASGAELVHHTVRNVVVNEDRVIIDATIEADILIAADGVESVVRRQLGIQPNGPVHTAVAIRGYTTSLSDRARLVSLGRDWPAYAWEFPLGDGQSNVGYGEVLRTGKQLTRQLLLERLERLMPGATSQAEDWRAARIPLSTHRPRQTSARVLLTGDAASLVNPMSGEGIWYAVKSGILAGRAAAHGTDAGRIYRAGLETAFGRNLRHANRMARLARVGSAPNLGTRMTVVDEDFFHDQVGVSIGGGTYNWPTAFRALARAIMQPHPGHVNETSGAPAG